MKIRKLSSFTIYTALSLLFLAPSLSNMPILNICNTESTIAPRADVLEWRYKIENGKKYMRLYNVTKHVWIGFWFPKIRILYF